MIRRFHSCSPKTRAGALRWQSTYDHADLGSNYFGRRGETVYARVGGVNHDGIMRFESARLTGAVRIAGSWTVATGPAVVPEGVWVGGPGWLTLGAPDLRVAAGEGDRARAADARAWAIQRYALPPAAH